MCVVPTLGSDAWPGRGWDSSYVSGTLDWLFYPRFATPPLFCLAHPWFELEHEKRAQEGQESSPHCCIPMRWTEIPEASGEQEKLSSSFKAIRGYLFFILFFFF